MGEPEQQLHPICTSGTEGKRWAKLEQHQHPMYKICTSGTVAYTWDRTGPAIVPLRVNYTLSLW